jgi:hypothetical protein
MLVGSIPAVGTSGLERGVWNPKSSGLKDQSRTAFNGRIDGRVRTGCRISTIRLVVWGLFIPCPFAAFLAGASMPGARCGKYIHSRPQAMRIWEVRDPVLVAAHCVSRRKIQYIRTGSDNLAMDGRPHPSEYAPAHTWMGTSRPACGKARASLPVTQPPI